MISKKEIAHLAALSRIALSESEEEALSKDLGKILSHFDELKEVNTDEIEPQTGGSLVHTVVRDDADAACVEGAEARAAFPEKESGLLRVPPVFE